VGGFRRSCYHSCYQLGLREKVGFATHARLLAVIDYATSCVRANTLGRGVADYVSRHAMRTQGDVETKIGL